MTLRHQNILCVQSSLLRGNENVLQITAGIINRGEGRRIQGCAITQQSEMGPGRRVERIMLVANASS